MNFLNKLTIVQFDFIPRFVQRFLRGNRIIWGAWFSDLQEK
ncbi:MAG: hypothetical protein ACJATC_001673 [Neptuniibacter pectenicola]|jgi:hypothetical protein